MHVFFSFTLLTRTFYTPPPPLRAVMGLSFCYFVPRAVCGSRHTLLQRANALVVFLGWLAIVAAVVLIANPDRFRLATEGVFLFCGTYAGLMLLAVPHFLAGDEAQRRGD